MYEKRDFRLHEIEIILKDEGVPAEKISRTVDGGIHLGELPDEISKKAWAVVRDYEKDHGFSIFFGLTRFTMEQRGICPERNTNTIDIFI